MKTDTTAHTLHKGPAMTNTKSVLRKNGMSKCVFRTDLRNQPVSEPLECVDAIEMFNRPATPTVEECVHMLLADDEICLGSSDKREIMQGPRVVGYIRIVDAS